jgi:hypothetical protein
MPDKVAFATTNWKDSEGKTAEFSQSGWDAYNSSKFNRFPFPILEKDQENNTFSDWDLETTYESIPSKSSDNLVSVLSPEYSYKFTFDQLFQVFWRMSHAKPKIKDANDITSTNNRVSQYTYDIDTLTITEDSKDILKDKESELVTKLYENKWEFYINNCPVGIDFTLPVLKTDDDEYRPYVYCGCCEPCNGPTSGQNVFEISKEKYYAYLRGGTWTLTSAFSETESAADGRSSNGGGSISGSGDTNGCSGYVSAQGTATVTYPPGGPSEYTISCSISYSLSHDVENDLYFVKLSGTAHEATSEAESSQCGYPTSVSITVDGENLPAFGTWCPGWQGSDGYTNTSSSTLTATYTPSS